MALLNRIGFSFEDDEAEPGLGTSAVWVEAGSTLANYQAMASALALKMDAVSDAELISISMQLELDLPGGLKAGAVAASLNERGGLIGFRTDGPSADSLWIPAFKRTIMSGTTISLTDAAVTALTDQLMLAVNTLTPVTRHGFGWDNPYYGRRSFRKS